MPAISEQVTIDGYTQAGATPGTNAFPAPPNPVLQIELSGLPGKLVVNGSNTVIRGVVINGAVDNITVNADNVTIAGNFIGTNATGTAGAPPPNGGFGIRHTAGDNMTIGGPNAADRNLISGDNQGGIIVSAFPITSGHLIQENFIGPDVTGTVSLTPITNPPGLFNVNNARVLNNLISGNGGGGLDTIDVSPHALVVRGNLIGTQANGTSPLPNGNFGGILLRLSNATVGGTAPGEANTIAFNTGAGIAVRPNANGNLFQQNSIHSNALLGIALQSTTPAVPLPNDAGDVDTVAGNRWQNYPVLDLPVIAAGSAMISGTLNSQASKQYRIEFFASAACGLQGYGQGQTLIGVLPAVVTDAGGNASFGPVALAVPAGQTVITATATDLLTNDTSEFSQCPVATGTTTALGSSLNPSVSGQSVTFTATVSGGVSPTGTVQFFDGATSLGTGALAGGAATLATSALSVGTHPITAVYSGDADDAASTSPVLSQVVNAAPPAATTTSLASSLNPSSFGQAVTFTATVSGGTSPTGTVQFRDGATVLGTVALAGTTAAFTTSTLAVGTHAIAAAYGGDVDDTASTSAPLSQVVIGAGTPPPSSGTRPIPVLSWPMLGLLAALLGVLGMRRTRR